MSRKLKHIIASVALLFLAIPAMSQLRPGMMLEGWFEAYGTEYYAEILTVKDKIVTCRFVHSGSVYTLQMNKQGGDPTLTLDRFNGTVQSSTGGKYGKGSIFYFVAFTEKGPCVWTAPTTEPVIVTFSDGRSFLGDSKMGESGNTVIFRHSGSKYHFNDRFVITKSGGTYKVGQTATIKCAGPILHD